MCTVGTVDVNTMTLFSAMQYTDIMCVCVCVCTDWPGRGALQ